MLPVLLQSMTLAAAGVFSVGSITLVLLLLMSPRGWVSGVAYAAAYTGAYAGIGVAVLLLGRGAPSGPPGGGGGTVSSVLLLVLAGLLLWVGQRNRRRAPAPPGEQSRLFRLVDRLTPLRAFGLGLAVSMVNVKNLVIFLSAVSVVVVSGLGTTAGLVVVLVDAVVFSAAVLVPVAVYAASPARARERLGRMRRLLRENARPIGIWVPTVFSIVFGVQGLRGLL